MFQWVLELCKKFSYKLTYFFIIFMELVSLRKNKRYGVRCIPMTSTISLNGISVGLVGVVTFLPSFGWRMPKWPKQLGIAGTPCGLLAPAGLGFSPICSLGLILITKKLPGRQPCGVWGDKIDKRLRTLTQLTSFTVLKNTPLGQTTW